METLFFIIILIMSVVIHEVSHGFMALRFGDRTALYAGRLTLNPLKHLDLFGSIILPLVLVFIKAPFLFGWAKPVPYNSENFTNKKWGEVFVASAGVLANISIAIIFGLILRYISVHYFSPDLISVLSVIVLANLGLAIFNLVPIPPLDGSKILFGLFPQSLQGISIFLERYSLAVLLLFIIFFSDYLYPILSFSYELITGINL